YTDVKIMSPATGMEMGIDEIGEICVSSPGVYGGKTYTEDEKNSGLFYSGAQSDAQYLRTGDLGRKDADGYLWITGRAKDLIIRGGHNIDPAEIEEALAGHDAVAFAGAIGQPDLHAGEVPCAYVELVEGAKVTPEELMAFAKDHIHERAAHPKSIEILDELPKTAVGKIFKPDLRKRAITRIYDAALHDLAAEVREVSEDKRRGLVAQIAKTGDVTEAEIGKALNAYTIPWELAD
ncbi:MAG: AMP-binding protein, partial [Paracoccaceae bacterium]|nr:AMP-binding protein [Paracoccaceae bacterium]